MESPVSSFLAITLSCAVAAGCSSSKASGVRESRSPAPETARLPTLEASAPGLVAELLTKAGMGEKTLAVGDFRDPEGRVTALSAFVAERLEMSFSERAAGALKVVSSSNMDDMVSEWDLSVKGRVDDSSLIEAGKLLGAQILSLGRYAEREGGLLLQAKLLDAKTGVVLAAAESTVRFSEDLRRLALRSAAPKEAAPKSGDLSVEIWSDKLEYKPGEKMSVSVRASQDCYLTLIDVGTSGKATVLFPNFWHSSNDVKAGVTYTIPDPEKAGFQFEVDGPSGREFVRAIVSKEPVVELADAMSQPSADAPFSPVKKDLGVLTRDIKVTAAKAAKGRWGEAVLKLTIR
ncbi:MAG: DUF4384 domain-containing protein [Elusimicrobia bacterium]|nr:DUF4384 domain-containing protein [Elusimicrobiota bacterium]